MIRSANAADFCRLITDETLLRIHALWQAYGDVPFIRYYADDGGSLLAVMDGVGYYSPADLPTEEWCLFLSMNPDIRHLRCPGRAGEALAEIGGWSVRTGIVLTYAGSRPEPSSVVCRQPSIPAVYALLKQCFDSLPPLEAWYPDVSHRVRHGCCMLASILEGEQVLSTAMTVAQADGHALLGQVATHPDYRCRSYAATCIGDLISRWQGDTLYIIPANENARKLYEKLGFRPWDTWAELTRT